jgi:hypothetical protein
MVSDQLAHAEDLLNLLVSVIGFLGGLGSLGRVAIVVGIAEQGHAHVHAALEHVVDEIHVARLEDVQREHHPWQEHDVRQGEDGKGSKNLAPWHPLVIQHQCRKGNPVLPVVRPRARFMIFLRMPPTRSPPTALRPHLGKLACSDRERRTASLFAAAGSFCCATKKRG